MKSGSGLAARPRLALFFSAAAITSGALVACRSVLGIDPLPALHDDAGAETGVADATARDAGLLADALQEANGIAEGGGCDPGNVALQFDPDNCGACGHRCCGTTCVDGGCVFGSPRLLEMGVDNPSAIALDPDGTSVYWARGVDGGGQAILRLAIGSAQVMTIATGLSYVNQMAVGSEAVFVTMGNGLVASVSPKTGGTPKTLATGVLPQGLAVVGQQLWWTDWGGGGVGQGSVFVANLDGTNARTVYGSASGPDRLAVAGATVAWSEFDKGSDLVVGEVDGGARWSFRQDPDSNPAPLALVDGGLIWGDVAQGQLWRLDFEGGTGRDTQIGGSGNGGIVSLALDGTYVYWVVIQQGGAGSLSASTYDGSKTMTLAPNLACPIDVATDGQCVYWVNAGNCTGAFQDYAPQPGTGSVMSLEVPR